jgi:hypothetical protein
VTWLETMGQGGGIATFGGPSRTAETPEELLSDSSDGWRAEGAIAALAGGGVAFIDDVIDGYSTRVQNDSPARTEPLEPLQGCQPTRPSAEAVVAHARASDTDKPALGLATYNDADLAAAVQSYAAHVRATGMKQRPSLNRVAFEAYDVAVTETARPVYLVLEAGAGQVIFNLHMAPGARLERVVILGGDQAGVANAAAGVPVEVMRSPELAACGLAPFYPLNPNHLFYQSVANGAIREDEARQRQAEFDGHAAAWETAFSAMFGVGAGETLAGGWSRGSLSVAGPVPATPETRAVWAPIEGSVTRLTLDQYVDHPGLEGQGADFASTVEAVATAFAWGDLKNLKRGVKF